MNFLVSACFFLFLLVVGISRGEQRIQNALFFAFRSQHKLVTLPTFAVGESSLVQEMMQCLTFCVNRPWCKSGNLQTTPNINGLYVCEALSTKNEYDVNTWLVGNSTFSYFRLKVKSCYSEAGCQFTAFSR